MTHLGISTACLYPLNTEEALELLGRLGVTYTEIFFNSPSELTDDFLKLLCSIKNRYGMTITSIHPYTSALEPFLFFTDYLRRFEDGRAWYQSYYRAAAVLEAPWVVLHGDRVGSPLPEEICFERFGQMARDARAYGVGLCQENVCRCRSRDSGFLRRMRDYLGGEAKFALDLKQILRSGEDLWQVVDAMGPNIVHLHLSDHRGPKEDCLPPGKGTADFPELFCRLYQQGFSGAGVLELYRHNYDRPEDLYQSLLWLQERISSGCAPSQQGNF